MQRQLRCSEFPHWAPSQNRCKCIPTPDPIGRGEYREVMVPVCLLRGLLHLASQLKSHPRSAMADGRARRRRVISLAGGCSQPGYIDALAVEGDMAILAIGAARIAEARSPLALSLLTCFQGRRRCILAEVLAAAGFLARMHRVSGNTISLLRASHKKSAPPSRTLPSTFAISGRYSPPI